MLIVSVISHTCAFSQCRCKVLRRLIPASDGSRWGVAGVSLYLDLWETHTQRGKKEPAEEETQTAARGLRFHLSATLNTTVVFRTLDPQILKPVGPSEWEADRRVNWLIRDRKKRNNLIRKPTVSENGTNTRQTFVSVTRECIFYGTEET